MSSYTKGQMRQFVRSHNSGEMLMNALMNAQSEMKFEFNRAKNRAIYDVFIAEERVGVMRLTPNELYLISYNDGKAIVVFVNRQNAFMMNIYNDFEEYTNAEAAINTWVAQLEQEAQRREQRELALNEATNIID